MRERERERMCVCVCVFACVHIEEVSIWFDQCLFDLLN